MQRLGVYSHPVADPESRRNVQGGSEGAEAATFGSMVSPEEGACQWLRAHAHNAQLNVSERFGLEIS